ncbi:UDP-4-amino-4,6-dideoxy-N-acetyl-beta-L-altrosamine N-acetyltransferase [Campylobacter coli]|nr:UDP-4-amino-4,6-dideoxy-N-acetyl-beta-L-altrosamine N-acetyltransferase [Campylobacter coli]EAI4264075.1 UDP-4-amino-4,6-dideoxy-N-acetyl-beta-L-altrosamine N-acetyltransferase [Campylobacter coli]EAI5447067.1 UDP-4-amino-4,6-dideoxy-N-acetyl-beta-L-altrosamine N-acetyltransferase [Campylobacter coli]EAJ6685034.1 UDP-4-amino-4,6-dideoxy-N-acetyl-beta-L-altrosamine N-acetyltransferase [Campylobacter coli]ECR9544460.1 UDP-4-amino-4,6-dideoxy-N-acetyl-beta-L-altrosamine N-acetyltransferase [Cam
MLQGGGKALILNLENFKTLNKTKKEKIRLFRNHPNTKKYLYNQHFISKKEHFNFIQKSKKNSKKNYFCLSLNHMILGSINLDKLDSFGFYSNPFSHLSGLGRILEQSSIYLACNFLRIKVLKLEIFQENLQVINLHKKFGFTIVKEAIKHDKKIFIMQLVF